MAFVQSNKVMLCPTYEKRLIEVHLRENNGKFVFYDGLEFDIHSGVADLLDECKFDERVRIFSIAAHMKWFCNNNNSIWDKLANVEHINFQGSYYQEVINQLLRKCTSMKSCSFTYWSARSFANVLEHISSPNLVQISAHVNGTLTNFKQTLDALALFGNRNNNSIMRLLLVFQEETPLFLNIDQHCFKKFGNLLAQDSVVTLLFNGEPGNVCVEKFLTNTGFTKGGYIHMAQNEPSFNDEFADKDYELYRYFCKESNGVTWCIGYRKRPKRHFVVLPSVSKNDEDVLQNKICCHRYNHLKEEHVLMAHPIEYPANKFFPNHLDVKVPYLAVAQGEDCCTFKKSCYLNDDPYLCAPLWENTLINKMIYHGNGRVEHFLSNGLYYMGCFGSPSIFIQFMDGRTTPRFIISSTVAVTNPPIPFRIDRLLSSVQTIELHGSWLLQPAQHVMERLQGLIKNLILMRLRFYQRDDSSSNSTLFNVISYIWPRFRVNVTSVLCDTRDIESGLELTRILDEMYGSLNPLHNLLLFVNESAKPLQESINKITKMVKPNATVTLIFIKRQSMDEIVIYKPKIHTVIIPPMFSNRKPEAMNSLMQCFSFNVNEIRWHLITPIPEGHPID